MNQEVLLAVVNAAVSVLEYGWTHGQCLPMVGGAL